MHLLLKFVHQVKPNLYRMISQNRKVYFNLMWQVEMIYQKKLHWAKKPFGHLWWLPEKVKPNQTKILHSLLQPALAVLAQGLHHLVNLLLYVLRGLKFNMNTHWNISSC